MKKTNFERQIIVLRVLLIMHTRFLLRTFVFSSFITILFCFTEIANDRPCHNSCYVHKIFLSIRIKSESKLAGRKINEEVVVSRATRL